MKTVGTAKLIFILFTILPLIPSSGRQLAAGRWHSVALKGDGTVWAWGNNEYGQLGDGTTNNRLTPGQVVSLTDVVSISGHGETVYTLALKRNGTVWAWGDNWRGSLGDGTTTTRLTPVKVTGLSEIVAISAGGYFSMALEQDGKVWTWGDNRAGQLGDGTMTDRWTPVQVVGLSNVIAISAGGGFSLALKNDGTIWGWGDNYLGQLGNGSDWHDTNSHSVLVPTLATAMTNVSSITSIRTGEKNSWALTSAGKVWLWGMYPGPGKVPIQLSGLPVVVAISAGYGHIIALAVDGTAWFMGTIYLDKHYLTVSSSLSFGPLVNSQIAKDSTSYSVSDPVPISGIGQVVAMAGGWGHSLFLKADGTIWGWGNNYDGQLGDGTTTSTLTPVRVKDLTTDSSDPIINPDVKVNNVDGPLTVSAFTPITVTVQISPAYLGLEADWWIAAQGGGNWFYLTLEDFLPKWTAMTDYTEMQPIYQGPLAPIGPVPIIESEYWLPRGDYEFFFAVDTLMDGMMTLDELHYDSVPLTIQ